MTRPILVSTITGALGTALAAAFGLNLQANQIGTVVTAASIGSLLLRQAVSPAAASPPAPETGSKA